MSQRSMEINNFNNHVHIYSFLLNLPNLYKRTTYKVTATNFLRLAYFLFSCKPYINQLVKFV